MSVYQYNPPAVGFAELSSFASTLATGSVPSPTIGTDTTSPSKGSASSRRETNVAYAMALVLTLTASFVLGMSLV